MDNEPFDRSFDDAGSEQPITLSGDDGVEHVCRVLGVFEFEEQEYALLLNTGEAGTVPSDDPETVLMRLLHKDDQAIFRMIEDDEEFARVTAYVKELVADAETETDEEDEL